MRFYETDDAKALAKASQLGRLLTPKLVATDPLFEELHRMTQKCAKRLDDEMRAELGFGLRDTVVDVHGVKHNVVSYALEDRDVHVHLNLVALKNNGEPSKVIKTYHPNYRLTLCPA
jgi:hypothetical protein